MTDSVLLPSQNGLPPVMIDDKSEAFRRASRHSSHVRWLRWMVLLGAIALAVGVVGYAFFDPFRTVLPAGASIDGAGLSGSRVTMAHPKMSGYRNDGRPYDFTAESAVQDLKKPNILELNQLDAHVTMADKSLVHIKARFGLYDTSQETMDLKNDIRITSDAGTDITMRTAHVEFKGGNVASNDPVQVYMKTGTVSSDSMHMTGNGTAIIFEGHVHSKMVSDADPTPTGAQLKGTAP